ncbi:MAG: hypothetical protein ACUVWN_05120 [bacterium]
MNRLLLYCFIILCYLSLFTCAGGNKLVDFVKEGGLETKGLLNLALASNGAIVTVSQENPDRPASHLIDGITSSEKWDQGEGWEISYEGFYARGEYIGYGVEDPVVVMERLRNRNRDDDSDNTDLDDPYWRGLRVQTRFGEIDTAMGWVVIEFPEEKTVNRAVIYTVDSEKYPADKYGVSDLSLQYWSESAKSWALVERIGKVKGQAGNSIQDNKSGIIAFRFNPVQTKRMRLIIRWTNDSKSVRRGYYQFTTGVIRLAEIEIYGYERDESAIVQAKSIGITQDPNETAEIQIIIDNYVDGYNKRNIDMLMSSISNQYSSGGETYQELRERLEAIFKKYDKIKLELSDIKVKLSENSSLASTNYKLQQESSFGVENKSGILEFSLSKSSGFWKITGIQQK